MYSLRRTLAVRFCLTMLVALTLIAAWAFLGTHRTLRSQLDAALTSALLLELDVVAAGAPLAPHGGPPELDRFIQDVNRFVVLRDAEGRVRGTNMPLLKDFPLDTAAFHLALRGRRTWTDEFWRDRWMRTLYAPVPPESPGDGEVLEVSASLEPVAAANRRVIFLMLGTVLLGTVATAFGAGWLGRSALAPVAEIAGQARGIQAGSPGQRITIHGDVEEFASLVGVLNGMLARLDDAFEGQRRIIADVGHELRTPLTAMRGEIEVALRGERAPDAYRATLRSVLEELDHLGSISEAMILLARVEAGELKPRPAPTDLGELTSAAVHRVTPRAGGRTLGFCQSGDLDATLMVDSGMMGVVLDHLLDNAVRYTPAGTHIEASVHADSGGASIAVRDTGPGIPDEILSHLFERFYRADPARSRTAGGGLGLTVARAIVDAHGGAISACNLPAGGFQVTVTLPRLIEPALTAA